MRKRTVGYWGIWGIIGAALLALWAGGIVHAYDYDCSAGRHLYEVTIVKQAKRDEDGLRRYTCTRCSQTVDEPIPMYGHTWGEWITEQEPTCLKTGVKRRYCTRHEHADVCEEEALPMKEHVYGKWEVLKEPTEETAGQRIRYCKYGCGTAQEETIGVKEISGTPPQGSPATGRNKSRWTILDTLLIGSSGIVTVVLGGMIISDLMVLSWFRRMQEETLRKWKNGESLYGD